MTQTEAATISNIIKNLLVHFDERFDKILQTWIEYLKETLNKFSQHQEELGEKSYKQLHLS